MCGTVGPIQRHEFEQLLDYDEAGEYRVKVGWWNAYWTTIHVHYFKDGVEVGYFTPCVNVGHVFERVREWHHSFKAALTWIKLLPGSSWQLNQVPEQAGI